MRSAARGSRVPPASGKARTALTTMVRCSFARTGTWPGDREGAVRTPRISSGRYFVAYSGGGDPAFSNGNTALFWQLSPSLRNDIPFRQLSSGYEAQLADLAHLVDVDAEVRA